MTTYEELLEEARLEGIEVDENYRFINENYSGLYIYNNIALSNRIRTYKKKAEILTEELGHHKTSYGNIINQTNIDSRKQELKARDWGNDHLIGLDRLTDAYESNRITSSSDMADFLNVTEEYLINCLERYKERYGCCVKYRGYLIMFEPVLAIMKTMK